MTLLFDLDGTLTDPGLGITNSVLYALKAMGIAEPPRESLYSFIGPPLTDSFQQMFGLSPKDADTAVRYYREYFSRAGMFENTVYPGIPELLQHQRDLGRTLCVATSKPLHFASQILSHFQLADYFHWICGPGMDERKTAKSDVVADALRKSGASAQEAVMIGDREHDVLGAARCGVRTIGVLYGYGSLDELTHAGAWSISETVEHLDSFLKNLEL